MNDKSISDYVKECHNIATEKGFNSILDRIDELELFESTTFTDNIRIRDYFNGTQIMMICEECVEAFQALRKGDTENFAEELADIAIKLFSFAGGMEIDLEAEIDKKMEKNRQRPYKHGKRF